MLMNIEKNSNKFFRIVKKNLIYFLEKLQKHILLFGKVFHFDKIYILF